MKRRNFGRVLAGGAIGSVATNYNKYGVNSAKAASRNKKKALMHVGGDDHSVSGDSTSKENLEFKVRHGVYHITAHVRKVSPEGAWDSEELKRMKENCYKHGVNLECLNLGDLLETNVERQRTPNISLGKSPERDREIDIIIGNIKKTAEVGIPAIRYHWRILPIIRNGSISGRGGATYPTFELEKNWRDLPMSIAGRVPLDVYWERITYFLERIIPVAEEYKVRMACHPPDPPLPYGYRGVDRWDSEIFEGLKQYTEIVESPYHGFLLCIGTVGEGLLNPGKDIYEIVRYLGERKKLFCIHLRNIRGGRDNFAEVYPDEGDMDFYKIIKVLRDVEYPYSILPDHMPSHPDDPGKLQGFAFGYGYIKALIQAVNSEA